MIILPLPIAIGIKYKDVCVCVNGIQHNIFYCLLLKCKAITNIHPKLAEITRFP